MHVPLAFRFSLETIEAEVVVPEGSVPGTTITTMVEGQQMQVVVPADAVPGTTIKISVKAMRSVSSTAKAAADSKSAVRREKVKIKVPKDWTPGTLLSVPTSQSKVLFSIPPGTVVMPGKMLVVAVPVRERPEGSAAGGVSSITEDWNPRDHFKESDYPNGDADVVCWTWNDVSHKI
jgi:hypothetical protein